MKNWGVVIFLILFSFFMTAQTAETEATTFQKETVAKQKIKVFPNPATNVINILGLVNSTQARIIISDLSGNVVLQHQWAIRHKSLSIPIPTLNSGIYVIRIESKEQQVQTKFYKK